MKNRLKELRKTQKWSQADLARRLNISRQAVNGFESGKFTPSLEMAFKIALLFNVSIDNVFSYQENNIMQTLVGKIDSFTQWLPRGERFTDEAINAIASAQKHAATLGYTQVEPENILYGIVIEPNPKIASLLTEDILSLNQENLNLKLENARITKLSSESKYILEQALNLARLNQQKQIKLEYLLLGFSSVNRIEK